MTLSQSRFQRILALCLLYFSQGVPYGYVYVTLAAILADGGHTLAQIGSMLALGSFPWTFKPLAAMAVDRFRQSPMGVRRPWILFALIGLALTTIILIFAKIGRGADFKVLMWGVLAQNIFAALQDVAADALAIDQLKPEERARANGMMQAAMQIGIMAGGVGATHILGALGVRGVLLIQVVLFLAIGSYFFAVREKPSDSLFPVFARQIAAHRPAEPSSSLWDLIREFARMLWGRRALSVVLCLFAAGAAGLFSASSSVFFVQHLRWSKEDYVALTGGWELVVGVLASIAGGLLADKLGYKRVAVGVTAILAAMMIAYSRVDPAWQSATAAVLVLSRAALTSTLAVSIYASLMEQSSKKVAATQFTFYMALLNLGGTTGAKAVGWVQEAGNWTGVFLTIGLLYGAVLIVLTMMPVQYQSKPSPQGELSA